MNKKIHCLILCLCLLFFSACSNAKDVDVNDKNHDIVYNLEYDQHPFQFNMNGGWRKFPNDDPTIAFLVGNDQFKSFMSAGFEPKKTQTLESYTQQYYEKLLELKSEVLLKPESRILNGLDTFYLEAKIPSGNKSLIYHIYLIETDDYYINLGAWTSQTQPNQDTLNAMNQILESFQVIK